MFSFRTKKPEENCVLAHRKFPVEENSSMTTFHSCYSALVFQSTEIDCLFECVEAWPLVDIWDSSIDDLHQSLTMAIVVF